MRKKTPPGEKTPPPADPTIVSLSQLKAIASPTLTIEVTIDGKLVKLKARRLTAAELAQVDDIRGSVIPPIEKGKTMEEDRPKYTDLDFIKKKRVADIQARALAVYIAVPIFSAEKPGLTSIEEITRFIQTETTDQVLDLLYQAVVNGGVSLAQLTNFS